MQTNKITFLLLIFFCFNSISFSKVYKGAEYRTNEAFIYGRFEVNYKPAFRAGVVSSFFTYHNITSQTGWNEIDIEAIGRYPEIIQFNTITPGQKFHIQSNFLGFNPFEDFHTYAFEWTPDYIAWFVDGNEVHRQTGSHVQTLQYEQKLMMNIWNPIYSGWGGVWEDEYLPAFSYYDFVSYSSYDPGNGDTGTENNFKFLWKDDLDGFDETRWSKATHTFGGNQCDFIKENVIFKDGYMILALTSENNIGYNDSAFPAMVSAMSNYDGTIKILFSEELDKISAETAGNYLIPGNQISSAVLNPSGRTVTVTPLNFDPFTPVNVIVMNVKDDEPFNNIMPTSAVHAEAVKEKSFPIEINVGGSAVGN